MQTIRTTTRDEKMNTLINLLDRELHGNYEAYQDIYAPNNQFEVPIKAVLITQLEKPIACGAFKEFQETKEIEIKRMFVLPDFRGQGISKLILQELETWGRELGYQKALLETGTRQVAAIHLYENSGYGRIPCYGPYVDLPESICMCKKLK